MKYTKELVEEICSYIRDGDSHITACKKVGISEAIFYEWKNNKVEFFEEIKKAHDYFKKTIQNKLEKSLWKKALGYEAEESEEEYIMKDGKKTLKGTKHRTKHFAPDTGALVFALTNVAPDEWKNKINSSVDANVKSEVTGDVKTRYALESLPDDMLFALADKLQENEANNGKNGEKEGDSEGKA